MECKMKRDVKWNEMENGLILICNEFVNVLLYSASRIGFFTKLKALVFYYQTNVLNKSAFILYAII